jgi:hypothetical protein
MSYYIDEGDIFEVIVTKDEEGNETDVRNIPFVNYVYGYGDRRGMKCPTITVAIVPKLDGAEEDGVCWQIGVALCSQDDFPSRAIGRKIATARANALSVDTDGYASDLRAKPYEKGDDAFGRIIGMRISAQTAPEHIPDLEFTESLTERVIRCCATLEKKFAAHA